MICDVLLVEPPVFAQVARKGRQVVAPSSLVVASIRIRGTCVIG